jgi:YVTN family beta-propeller protein
MPRSSATRRAIRFSNPDSSRCEYGRLSGSAQTRSSDRASLARATPVAASARAATATRHSGKGEDIQRPSLARIVGQVLHGVDEALGRSAVAPVELAGDNRTGPAADSRQDRDVLLAVRAAVGDRLADDARAGLELPQRRPTLAAALFALAGTSAAAAFAAPFAYVPNEKSGTVSVIDTATDTVARTITTGGKPRGIAASPDGSILYVSEQTGNALLVIDTAGGQLRERIGLGESPEGISLSRDGALLAVGSELANGVILVGTGGAHRSAAIKVPGPNPEHAVFSPDGRWLYVSAENGAQVDVIDVAEKRVVSSVAPDGGKVYVSSGRGARVDVLDMAARRISASIPVGQRPWNMALTPDGRKLYVANGRSGTASVIDTVAGKRIADVPVGELPWGVVIR